MLTAKACRVRAAELSRQAAESTDEAQVSKLETMAEEWTALEATVAAMEAWEARFIHGRP